MTTENDALEQQLAQWRSWLGRRPSGTSANIAELEDQLRAQATALADAGLPADEALLLAIKRVGNLDAASREYSEQLWKQLLMPSEGVGERERRVASREMLVVLGLAAAAALAIKLPAIFGFPPLSSNEELARFYYSNLSFFVLPFLACYFVWKRGLDWAGGLRLGLTFAAAAILINAFPFAPGGDTQALAALHLPIALWFVVGLAYAGVRWRTSRGRMDFVRFSGEFFIYYVLMALGGGVLTALTLGMFASIGLDEEAQRLLQRWLLPCGAMGAVIIGAWLVEAKQNVMENMAPVLTRIFTPLFAAVLLAFLATMAWTGSGINVEREVLISFDLLLAVVLGLLLYAVSSRDPQAPPGIFDAVQLLLIVAALTADMVALAAISVRLSEFGFTPNRMAALGENLILLVNLAWSAWLYAAFLLGRGSFAAMERWQTAYLPVYALWAAFVAFSFPPLFGFM